MFELSRKFVEKVVSAVLSQRERWFEQFFAEFFGFGNVFEVFTKGRQEKGGFSGVLCSFGVFAEERGKSINEVV